VHINLRFETLKLQYGFCRSQQGRHVFTDRHMSIAAVKGLKDTVSFVLSHLHDSVTESSSSKILMTTLWLHDYMGFLAAFLRFSL
jgi:hypothetical protein